MNPTVHDHLVGLNLSQEFWSKGLEDTLREIVKASHAVAGLIVLYSGEEKAFVEAASVGYDDSGFYYEFLARGLGNFEKLESSPKPIIFQKQNGFSLFHPESLLAVVSRVYGKQMYGFVLVEVQNENLLSLVSWIVSLFANRIVRALEQRTEKIIHTTATVLPGVPKEDIWEILLEKNFDWQNNVRKAIEQKVFSISGAKGSGKKQVLKYIHKRLDFTGELVFLNLIPQKIVKLEKSIQEWNQIAGNGFVIIENTYQLSSIQQRFFWEYIKQENPRFCFVFLDDPKNTSSEVFPAFQKMIREHQFHIPAISFLEKEKRLSILSGLIKEVGSLHNIKGLSVSMESMDFLLEKSQDHSLEEIRNVLEFSVLKSKGSSLQKSDLQDAWSDSNRGNSSFEYEDLNLRKSVEALERQKILLALKLFSGNQMRMAKALGISRGSLQYKMKQMELL